MVRQTVPPLPDDVALIDIKTGRPTVALQQYWQGLFQNDSTAFDELDTKLDNEMATSRLLGRNDVGTGEVEQLTLSEALDLIGSAAQGDILYRGASAWARLGAGSSGQFLKTLGTGANPAWDSVGGGGAMTLISEQTPTGTGTVTFSSISGSYRDLLVRVRGRGTTAATNTAVSLRMNNDSGGNYAIHVIRTAGSATVASATARGGTEIQIGNLPASTATASYAGSIETLIADYRGTSFHKVATSRHAFATADTDAGHQQTGIFTGFWRSTSAVTRVDVILAAGNFDSGSVVSLYGVT